MATAVNLLTTWCCQGRCLFTLPREAKAFRKLSLLWLSIVCLLTASQSLSAASATEVIQALDLNASPSPIEYVKQVYRQYTPDEAGNIDEDVYKDTISANNWKIQTKTEYTTAPKVGGNCLRSYFGGYGKVKQDARAARIYFRVYGAGTLNFWYKTSCDDGYNDGLRLWIDESLVYTDSGYGEQDNDDNWIQYGWRQVNDGEGIQIEGYNDERGDYYHEIIIEFNKGEADYDDGKYIYEPTMFSRFIGWEKPQKNDYDDEDSYNSDLAEYLFVTQNFQNCIWLDQLTWKQKPLELSFSKTSDEIYEEIVTIDFLSNVQEFGYHIRYTTDGSEPTVKSTLYNPNSEDSTLVFTETTIVKAAIFGGTINDPEALPNTASIEGTFTIRAAPPTISIASEQPDVNSVRIKLSKDNSAERIYYTTNGIDPTTSSALLAADGFLSVTDKVMVKAICVREGVEQSHVAEFNDIDRCPIPKVTGSPSLPTGNAYYLDDSSTSIELTVLIGEYTLLISHDNAIEYSYSGGNSFQYKMLKTTAINSETISFRNVQLGMLPSERVVVSAYRKLTYQINDSSSEANQFSSGWNLVSFLLKPDEATLQSLMVYPIFAISNSGTYTPVKEINMNQVYWIYLPDNNIQLLISGYNIPSNESSPSLTGWKAKTLTKEEFDITENKWEFINSRFQRATVHTVGRVYFVYSK